MEATGWPNDLTQSLTGRRPVGLHLTSKQDDTSLFYYFPFLFILSFMSLRYYDPFLEPPYSSPHFTYTITGLFLPMSFMGVPIYIVITDIRRTTTLSQVIRFSVITSAPRAHSEILIRVGDMSSDSADSPDQEETDSDCKVEVSTVTSTRASILPRPSFPKRNGKDSGASSQSSASSLVAGLAVPCSGSGRPNVANALDKVDRYQ